MRVRATCTLKNKSVGIISAGTIFEGTEETLPEFVLSELKEKRGTFEILIDVKPKKKKRGPKPKKNNAIKPSVKAKAESPSKEKPATLREKLTKTEK